MIHLRRKNNRRVDTRLTLCLLLLMGLSTAASATPDFETAFEALSKLHWVEVFSDDGTENWQDKWIQDGENGVIKNTPKGMDFASGQGATDDDHEVIWTKDVFKGDLRIDYDFTRLDHFDNNVCILYVQATGKGTEEFPTDIMGWSAYRKMPKMSHYFKNMNLLHISYAVRPEGYVRARRYPILDGKKWDDTKVEPLYFDAGLFETDQQYHITVIKKDSLFIMEVQGRDKRKLFGWDISNFDPVTEGRVGFRQMFKRHSRYANIRISTLPDTPADRGQLLWYGDPDKGRDVFNNLNFEGAKKHSPGSGTILPATDPVYGKIWRVYKPAADKRAEIRGAAGWSYHEGKGGSMKQGVPYYIGWRYKFDMPDKKTGGWACFQWKSYPSQSEVSNQNYPLHMTYNGRELALIKNNPNWQKLRTGVEKVWSHPVDIGTWVDVVLVINPSRDETEGYFELYFNGQQQTFQDGSTRIYHKTMDGLEVAPKWGAYNRAVIGTEVTVNLADLRIGTSLQSVISKPQQSQ